jgi:hypothetical protein
LNNIDILKLCGIDTQGFEEKRAKYFVGHIYSELSTISTKIFNLGKIQIFGKSFNFTKFILNNNYLYIDQVKLDNIGMYQKLILSHDTELSYSDKGYWNHTLYQAVINKQTIPFNYINFENKPNSKDARNVSK